MPPSLSTLARWVKSYVISGGDVTALAPQHNRKGSRQKKFSMEVENVITRALRDDFLKLERPSVKQIHCNVIGRAIEEAAPAVPTSLPSVRTIHRRVKELDPYICALKRYGPQYADKHFRAAGASLEASRLMEMVMIDGHQMDVLVIDSDTGEVLGRPFLVCLFDVLTRCVVGWYISLLPFCATTALGAIKDMCSRDPLAGPGGVAEAITPDNGPDLASAALRNLCKKVGMHINPAKTYCPNDKAHLERFFRTLNEQLIHLIQGTTFSSPAQRGEYDSTDKATISLQKLRELFENWVENVYHCGIHSGTGRAPALFWRDQQALMPILSFSREDIDVIARISYKRQITNGRVLVENLYYKSDALATLEQRNQRDVTVLLNELDLGYVYVQHDSDPSLIIRADGVRTEYTKNLTMYEHKEVQKRLKLLTQKDLEELGPYAYEIARWRLWCEIHDVKDSTSARRLKLLTEGVGKKQVAKEKMATVLDGALPLEFISATLDSKHPMAIESIGREALAIGIDSFQNITSDNSTRELQSDSVEFDTFEL
jgi:putative transposase